MGHKNDGRWNLKPDKPDSEQENLEKANFYHIKDNILDIQD